MTVTKAMKTKSRAICPRCGYDLIPVHAVEGRRRRVVALTCPEPYCDHMQMVTKKEAKTIGGWDGIDERRAQ